MTTKKKVILLVILLVLVALITVIGTTYAKYRTTTTGTASASIARWNIKVNNNNVKNNTTLSESLKVTFPGNEYMAANVVAPTAEGYFDIEIDASEVDVTFDYTIKITENANVKDFVVSGYSIGENGTKQAVNGSITNTIAFDATEKKQLIRVYLTWIDDENATMDNSEDTKVTIDLDNITMDVSLSFVQKAA